ncbi:MAG: T9SS type A sorting domain-containing protein [Bacteroidales bacterium]|nr:T9SS type A sorting domain-containing protein [Bacteroidales bacterium]
MGERCEISVYSVLGKLMGKFTNNVIELSEFPSGVYFVTVTSGSGIATAKILKK